MRILFQSYGMILLILLTEVFFIVGMRYFLLKQCRKWEENQSMTAKYETMILEDIKCFPVPLAYKNEVVYEDSYGEARNNGEHEGCDIMDSENRAGRIPIVSATDGVISNVGWLYLGGYRIGITSDNNIYYYYAHLDSYAAGICVGREIKAGELLGFMGNTGEGAEGTSGLFPVHLHFGIYVRTEERKEEAVNSYPFLRKIDER